MTSKVHIDQKAGKTEKVLRLSGFIPYSSEKRPKSASLAQFPEENYSSVLRKMPRLAYFDKVFAHHFPY